MEEQNIREMTDEQLLLKAEHCWDFGTLLALRNAARAKETKRRIYQYLVHRYHDEEAEAGMI